MQTWILGILPTVFSVYFFLSTVMAKRPRRTLLRTQVLLFEQRRVSKVSIEISLCSARTSACELRHQLLFVVSLLLNRCQHFFLAVGKVVFTAALVLDYMDSFERKHKVNHCPSKSTKRFCPHSHNFRYRDTVC